MRGFVLLGVALCLRGVAGAQEVAPAVVRALAEAPRVRVIVGLRHPRAATADLAALAASVAAAQDRLLDRVGPDFVPDGRWTSVHAMAGEVTRGGLAKLASDPDVVRVDLDPPGGGALAESVPLIRANALHAIGVTGKGVTVAILDTGIEATHPDLGDDLVAEQCFCSNADGSGCCPGGARQASGAGAARDDHGHGTHVAGIVTSAGRVAPRGVAPDAKVVAVKVLDGQNRFSSLSQVISGLDWVASSRPDVRVVNMSLGTDLTFEGACDGAGSFAVAFAELIGTLRARGVSVFASSMNGGLPNQMAIPACVAGAVAVAATYDARLGAYTGPVCSDPTTAPDMIACFSNRGSALDLLAPGALITSTGLGGGTSSLFGTSQASAHAAGAAALLLEVDPAATPARIESALESTGVSVVDPKTGLAYPRIDVAAAASFLPGTTSPAR